MQRFIILILLLCITGCGTANDEPDGKTTGTAAPSPPVATPTKCVETFNAAVLARDRERMSECVAEVTTSKKLTKQTVKEIPEQELNEMASFIEGYEITGEEIDADTAVVRIKYKTKRDRISLVKVEEGWKITDL